MDKIESKYTEINSIILYDLHYEPPHIVLSRKIFISCGFPCGLKRTSKITRLDNLHSDIQKSSTAFQPF